MSVFPVCSGKISNPIFRLDFSLRMTHISHGHRFSLHPSPTCPARICSAWIIPSASQPSSHNCWAPRDYFPLPNGFHIRGKALNSLLHKGTATLSRKQMLQEHKCHEIPQLLFPEQKRKSIPKAPVSWALSLTSTEGNPASPSFADGLKLIISASARSPQDFQGWGQQGRCLWKQRETTKSPGRMDGRGGGELLWLRKGKGLVERNAIKAPWRQKRVMERSVPFNNALFFLVQMKYLATSTGRVQLEVNDQTGGP